ncbi:MAG: nuclear transport factor 2 family protein [Sphingomonas adhaesiva]|uniref:nuclear transport factor 2 family protein n=1 Tax=Sphingomonas adhaesiva TaxID=28212 RepID=UPI002FFBF626
MVRPAVMDDSSVPSPTDLIRAYWEEVWNRRRAELIGQLCHDQIIRHDPSCVNALSAEAQIARVRQQSEMLNPRFTHEVLLGDDRFVCSVWNMTTTRGERVDLSGIEVFEVSGGRFSDCWNTPYSKGFWARAGEDRDIFHPRDPVGGVGDADGTAEVASAFLTAWASRDEALLRSTLGDGAMRYRTGEATAVMPADLLDDPVTGSGARIAFDALFAQGDLACAVWNLHPADPDARATCGIDVVRVAGGRVVEWWAPPRTAGAWGRDGDGQVPGDLPPPVMLASVEEIDGHWLQAVFRHAGLDLPRISMARIAPLGHGNVSDTVRVAINYNKPVVDEPTSVVCKFHSRHEGMRDLVAAIDPYRAEVEAYRLFGDTPPLRTARAWHVACSGDGHSANLVLEDLGAFCTPGDQIAGCSTQDAAAVVHELGRLHARFWRAPELTRWPWIAANRAAAPGTPDFYAVGLRVFEDRYAADMGQEDMDIIRAFAALRAAWGAHDYGHATLIHADPRVDNVMFDRRGAAPLAYLIDWQMVSRGAPAIDLAYFLTGSLSVEDRRAVERALIADHAAAIGAIDPAYTPARAEADYRIAAASGLAATVGAAAVMPDTPHNRALLVTLARRNVAAVRDWGTIEALARAGA